MECESEDQEYLAVIAVEEHFNSVTSAGNRNQVFATLTVNGKETVDQLWTWWLVCIGIGMYGEDGLLVTRQLVWLWKTRSENFGQETFRGSEPKEQEEVQHRVPYCYWRMQVHSWLET